MNRRQFLSSIAAIPLAASPTLTATSLYGVDAKKDEKACYACLVFTSDSIEDAELAFSRGSVDFPCDYNYFRDMADSPAPIVPPKIVLVPSPYRAMHTLSRNLWAVQDAFPKAEVMEVVIGSVRDDADYFYRRDKIYCGRKRSTVFVGNGYLRRNLRTWDYSSPSGAAYAHASRIALSLVHLARLIDYYGVEVIKD